MFSTAVSKECELARFGKLEFDDEDSLESTPSGVVSEKNETHWLRLADANRRTGSHENALRFYSRALEIDRSLIVAWVGHVQMLVMLGEYPQASTWSKKALELYPNNTELLAGQAQAECRLGDFKQANALIDGAMKVRGDSAYNWQVRGELMLALKQKTDRHCFDKAQISSSDSLVPLETAQIYIYTNSSQKASSGQHKPLKNNRILTLRGSY